MREGCEKPSLDTRIVEWSPKRPIGKSRAPKLSREVQMCVT